MLSTRRRFLASAGAAMLGGCAGIREPDDGLHLRSVAVDGSPGGEVPLLPSGRVVLIEFFATWCSRCGPQMDALRKVRDRFSESELAMRSITAERDPDRIREYWETYAGSWPVLLDEEMAAYSRYDASRLPTIYVLKPDGEEAFSNSGYTYRRRMESAVEDALDGGR